MIEESSCSMALILAFLLLAYLFLIACREISSIKLTPFMNLHYSSHMRLSGQAKPILAHKTSSWLADATLAR